MTVVFPDVKVPFNFSEGFNSLIEKAIEQEGSMKAGGEKVTDPLLKVNKNEKEK